MFRLRHFVTWLGGVLLLALVSRPLFTSVHNRIGKLKDSPTPKLASVMNEKEKSAKAHQLNTDYGKLPIYFESNLGQTDSQVKFIARGTGATTFLTATETVFSLPIADFGLPNGNKSIKRVAYAGPASRGQHPFDVDSWNSAVGRTNWGFGPASEGPLHTPRSAIANRQSQCGSSAPTRAPKSKASTACPVLATTS